VFPFRKDIVSFVGKGQQQNQLRFQNLIFVCVKRTWFCLLFLLSPPL